MIITNLLNPPIWAERLAPTLTTEILALVNQFLPPMGGIGRRRARGYESEINDHPFMADIAGRRGRGSQQRVTPAAD